MPTIALLLALCCDVRELPIMETRVEIVDTNTVYCDGVPQLLQQIWWDDEWYDVQLHVIAWRLRTPVSRFTPYKGVSIFVDTDGTFRKVWARTEIESHLPFDTEVTDRESVAIDQRRELGRRP